MKGCKVGVKATNGMYVGPPTTPGGVFIRRSEFDDQPGIQALIGQEAEQVAKRFRHVDVTNMIENASLGITAVDEKGAVVGYAAFYDFPALTSEVDPVAWPEWLHGAFGHPEFTEANTAFLSFFLADPLCESEVLENILRTAFTTLPDVDALLFLLPRDVKLFAPLRDDGEGGGDGGEGGARRERAWAMHVDIALARHVRLDTAPVVAARLQTVLEALPGPRAAASFEGLLPGLPLRARDEARSPGSTLRRIQQGALVHPVVANRQQ